jgi:hypothetical protein
LSIAGSAEKKEMRGKKGRIPWAFSKPYFLPATPPWLKRYNAISLNSDKDWYKQDVS